jgi:hypothetical protein
MRGSAPRPFEVIMHTRRNVLTAGISLGLVSACSSPPPSPPPFPDIRFPGASAMVIDAIRLEIRSQQEPGEFDRSFPVPPLQAMMNWGRDRLKASGRGTGILRFTIIGASAVQKNLTTKGGVSGTFTDQISQQYDVAVEGTVEILDDHGMAVRTARASANRSRSVLQSATPNERDTVRYEMVKALMADFDQQMEGYIRNNFGLYLLSR